MCGLAGYLFFNQKITETGLIFHMSRKIQHRGPDDEGFMLLDTETMEKRDFSSRISPPEIVNKFPELVSDRQGFPHMLGLSQRRFSIIDLTPAGHQPMWNGAQSICIAYNGEIFNYIELRYELEKQGMVFVSRSDTEVILNAYQYWGLEAFEKFTGFWAVCLVDLGQKRLVLSRDRIGKKPLYLYRDHNCFVWASEIKSILAAVNRAHLNLDDEVIYNYLVSGIKDVNHSTFWKEIRMMDNATTLLIDMEGETSVQRYWQIPDVRMSEKEAEPVSAVNDFRDILKHSLLERLRADVPVAFELSGGLDSSTLVAYRAHLEKEEFAAFTVKYDDRSVDESDYAVELASHYPHINHHLINFQEENLWHYLGEFIYLMEEPFHGPVLLIGQLLRKKMRERGYKVIIGGAGGDEIFAGYTEYAIPTLRKLLKENQYSKFLKNLICYKEKYPLSLFPLMALLLRKMFRLKPDDGFFNDYLNISKQFRSYVQYPKDVEELFIQNMKDLKMYYWMSSNDKSDMGIPIEVRNPFLDHRVVDYLFRLPVSFFFNDGWLKWFLRRSFQDILPPSILWRKRKRGFPFPLDKWLLGNQEMIKEILMSHDTPWIQSHRVIRDYRLLVRKDPAFLWRMVNYQLWLTRVVDNHPGSQFGSIKK